MYFSNIDYFYGPYLICKCTHTCINSSQFTFYFIWNNSQLLCLVNKNVGACTYIKDRRLPSERMYVPVYICVFNFVSETTGPMKPKCMWNQNRTGEES